MDTVEGIISEPRVDISGQSGIVVSGYSVRIFTGQKPTSAGGLVLVRHDHAAFGVLQTPSGAETKATYISTNAGWEIFMSRNWQVVSKAIQQLAANRYPVKSEGMFPYDTHYVLATEEEMEHLKQRAAALVERLCA